MVSNYDFKYKGLMRGSMQSIPLGNGDLGANIWAEENALFLLLSKTDSFSRLHRLLKTGFLKISFPEGALGKEPLFHLSLGEGILRISGDDVNAEIYIDANAPIYKIKLDGNAAKKSKLEIINYREKAEKIAHDNNDCYQLNHPEGYDIGFDCTEDADTVFSGEDFLGQYHRNGKSLYDFSLEHQHLADFPEKSDYLTGLTFGFCAKSEDMRLCENSLIANKNADSVSIEIHSLTEKCASAEEWLEKIKNFPASDRAAHLEYWKSAWKKSYIYMSGSKKAKKITEAVVLQRYMLLSAGRGKRPIKFNGSIFTCQPSPHRDGDYDYRRWGSYYWLQNTRLIYWAMLAHGDYDLMMPFFRLYTDNLSFAKYRTQQYFGHGGACYPETMSLFAAYADTNYGWERENLPDGVTVNTYIRYYYCGALETALMMMLYCRSAGDTEFLQKECLPFTEEVLRFFYEHFGGETGKMHLEPTSSLETWHSCVNDSPNIAGLTAVSKLAIKLCGENAQLKTLCENILRALPPMPFKKKWGKKTVAPFERNVDTKKMNVENPELYTVFPYGLYRIGSEDLKIGVNTFKKRVIKDSCGWQQHGVQAALLGLSKDAFAELYKNSANTNKNCIFPAFYGPNYDWLPDQDNGSNTNLAAAAMLVQSDDEKIYLLPAWNKRLSVSFRLPVGDNFITVTYKKGRKPVYEFDKPEKREVVVMI